MITSRDDNTQNLEFYDNTYLIIRGKTFHWNHIKMTRYKNKMIQFDSASNVSCWIALQFHWTMMWSSDDVLTFYRQRIPVATRYRFAFPNETPSIGNLQSLLDGFYEIWREISMIHQRLNGALFLGLIANPSWHSQRLRTSFATSIIISI